MEFNGKQCNLRIFKYMKKKDRKELKRQKKERERKKQESIDQPKKEEVDQGCLTLDGYRVGRPKTLPSEPTSATLAVTPKRRDNNLTIPHTHTTVKKKKKNKKKVNQ